MKKTIYVVDDEQDFLKITKVVLESEGYNVKTFENGESALTQIELQHPDLLILDVVMPGIHGLDICRTLKRSETKKNIPILLYTALGTEIGMMLEEGDKANDILSKPFAKNILLERVEKLLK